MGSLLVVHACHEGGMKVRVTAGEHTVKVDYPMPDSPAGCRRPWDCCSRA